MRRDIACVSTLTMLLIVLLASSLVSAATIVVNQTDRGWYRESGTHQQGNSNYAIGDFRGGGGLGGDYRNFFVFDLAGVTQPIASAKLALFVPAPTPAEPTHKVTAARILAKTTSCTMSPHQLRHLRDGTGGVAAHTDLGSGVVYGSRTMTAADMGSVVEITLNSSAIAALDSAHGLFGIGGSLTTLDGLANYEITFGCTGHGTEITQLRLTLVPEPSTLLLLGIGAISLLGYRKAKS